MVAGLVLRRDALLLPLPVEPRAVEIELRRVVRRCGVVDVSGGGVHAHDVGLAERAIRVVEVERARGDEPALGAVARDHVEVSPPVPLADPGETLAAVDPAEVVVHIHPGAVALGVHDAGLARGCVAEHHLDRVLRAVHVLEDDLGRAGRPLQPRDVVVARVAGDVEPDGRATVGAHDTDACRGVGGAGLGVLHGDDERVERVGVVDQVEVLHARGVELPERDPPAVGAPAEPVAQVELLLVDPVERPVDDGARPVVGELRDRAVGQPLDVEVVLAHIGDAPAVGRELGEHERRRRRLRTAELLQLPGGEIERPVVAARVLPPDFPGVGEQQHMLPVRRHLVVLDRERERIAGGDEPSGGHPDLAPAGGRVVAHQRAAFGGAVGLELHVGRLVLEPAGSAEVLGVELAGEDPVERERGRVGLGEERRRRGREEERDDGGVKAKVWHGDPGERGAQT